MEPKDETLKLNIGGKVDILPTANDAKSRVTASLCVTNRKDLQSVQFPALQVACNTLGLNKTFPRCVLFGDFRYQGINLDNLYVTQGAEKLKYFVGHL